MLTLSLEWSLLTIVLFSLMDFIARHSLKNQAPLFVVQLLLIIIPLLSSASLFFDLIPLVNTFSAWDRNSHFLNLICWWVISNFCAKDFIVSHSFGDSKTNLVLNFEVNFLQVIIVNLRFFFELNLLFYFWGMIRHSQLCSRSLEV